MATSGTLKDIWLPIYKVYVIKGNVRPEKIPKINTALYGMVASNQKDSFRFRYSRSPHLFPVPMAESAKRLLDLQPVREDERRSPDHKKSKQEKKEEKRREKKEKKAEKKAAKNERREEQAKHWREQIANTPHRPYTDPSEETITPPR